MKFLKPLLLLISVREGEYTLVSSFESRPFGIVNKSWGGGRDTSGMYRAQEVGKQGMPLGVLAIVNYVKAAVGSGVRIVWV